MRVATASCRVFPVQARVQLVARRLSRALCVAAILGVGVTASRRGDAHINLLSPAARQPGKPEGMLRIGPCAQRRNARVSDTATVFRPGETIDVSVEVYVQHPSYFRIAFDPTGDDSFFTPSSIPEDPATDPTTLPTADGELVLAYVHDRTGDVAQIEQRVTLPSEPCETCTLQVTQVTYGLPVGEGIYYQCADLTLAGEPLLAANAPADAGAAGPLTSDPDGSSGCSLPERRSRESARSAVLGLLALLGVAQGRRSLRRQ